MSFSGLWDLTVLSPRTLSSPSPPGRANTSTFSRLTKLTWMNEFWKHGKNIRHLMPHHLWKPELLCCPKADMLPTRLVQVWSDHQSKVLNSSQVTNTVGLFGNLPIDGEADCEGEKTKLLLQCKLTNKHRVDIHSGSLSVYWLYYQGETWIRDEIVRKVAHLRVAWEEWFHLWATIEQFPELVS